MAGTGILQLLWQATAVWLLYRVARAAYNLFQVRRRFQRLQKAGLPMPPHHPISGHLFTVGKIMAKYPINLHGHTLPLEVKRAFPELGPVFYIDTTPFGPPMLIATSPETANQFTSIRNLLKAPEQREFMRPVAGKMDLTTMEGREWKMWSNIFQPGFNSAYLMTRVPDMLEEYAIFHELLKQYGSTGKIFQLEPEIIKLSLDIIGRMVINASFNAQKEDNELTSALRAQIRWMLFGHEVNKTEMWNPLRPLVQWWHSRKMERYVSRALDERFLNTRENSGLTSKRSRTIMDLALESYVGETDGSGKSKQITMDSTFRDAAVCHIRTFLFAGHDTTSSTLCYCFHLISSHPEAEKQIIDEHNRVLGPDISQAASKIRQNPHILNQLPFTIAVIKETMRLFPPASSTRSGASDFSIVLSDGRECPSEGLMLWSNHYAMHHSPELWPKAESFLPQRWLNSQDQQQDNPLSAKDKHAWRPFEFGPRNCIGQELAMQEMKLTLALTVREFRIENAYAEYDRLHSPGKPRGTFNGNRAYQILHGSAHPVDGFPCRVVPRSQ